MLRKSDYCNIPNFIEDKLGRKLHNQKNHPIEIIKNHIYQYFLNNYQFEIFDDLSPIVTVEDNFDKLLILKDHPARSKSDTYYINEREVLRTHTSAHQNELLGKGITNFLVTGDVYRKDEIDAHHYPVFHQMEIFMIVDGDPEFELKKMLSGLVEYLFPNYNYRFNDDYFPFTNPSYEVEVEYRGKWVEILGGGIVQPVILVNNGIIDKKAIAAGLGIDRLVMIFADIPDIRYLWSTHERFLKQFESGKITKFVPYSKLPNRTRDISFFVPKTQLNDDQTKWLNENDFCETVRNHVGDNIESVKLLDSFHNEKLDKYSRIYRLTYSPTGPDMKDSGAFTKYVNLLENKLREALKDQLELR